MGLEVADIDAEVEEAMVVFDAVVLVALPEVGQVPFELAPVMVSDLKRKIYMG